MSEKIVIEFDKKKKQVLGIDIGSLNPVEAAILLTQMTLRTLSMLSIDDKPKSKIIQPDMKETATINNIN